MNWRPLEPSAFLSALLLVSGLRFILVSSSLISLRSTALHALVLVLTSSVFC